nr:MAG TPA: hypothetical protein [Caudoviricetes sp.]
MISLFINIFKHFFMKIFFITWYTILQFKTRYYENCY